jgi:hypothetical protein
MMYSRVEADNTICQQSCTLGSGEQQQQQQQHFSTCSGGGGECK